MMETLNVVPTEAVAVVKMLFGVSRCISGVAAITRDGTVLKESKMIAMTAAQISDDFIVIMVTAFCEWIARLKYSGIFFYNLVFEIVEQKIYHARVP
jgi:hypothetical protein